MTRIKDTILKAVLNKVYVWKKMYANHEATADEINDRNWHGMCVVLTDRISELESIINKARVDPDAEQLGESSVDNSYTGQIAQLQKQLEAVRKRVLNCQQYTTNSAMVHEGRFMEVVAIKAAIGEET